MRFPVPFDDPPEAINSRTLTIIENQFHPPGTVNIKCVLNVNELHKQ